MAKIKEVSAREILDSRGNETFLVKVTLSDGAVSYSSVPSGTFPGTYEALEIKDVDQAIANIRDIIAPKIVGMEAFEQQKIDLAMLELDGTQNKSNLGANVMVGVSQAIVKAAAKSSILPTFLYIRQFVQVEPHKKIPIPMFNILEGGKHAGNQLNFQEFLVIPASSKSFQDAISMGTAVYHALQALVYEKGHSALVAEEGGFAPNLESNQAALSFVKEAIDKSGFVFTQDVFMGIDACSNTFLANGEYKLKDKSIPYAPDELVEFYKTLFEDFSLIYIEDPFGEDDWDAWGKIQTALGEKTTISGDDIVATNPYRLQRVIGSKLINAVVIKPNQIGTVTEAIAVAEMARYSNLKIVVSTRSGETTDDFIADFAVGIAADYAKFGAPARERVIKYNRLSEISYEMQAI